MCRLNLPNFPFSVGTYEEREERFPSRLPFILCYDQKVGFIFEEVNEEIREALKLYYSLGGYGSTPLGEGEYAQKQGVGVFEIIKKSLEDKKKLINKTSFLEIGASYGYLLYLLKEAGAKEVISLEPGDEGVVGSRKYNVPVVQDFFPSKLLTKKFDYIMSHCVLEHIENPLFIFEESLKALNDEGMIFVAVPDCEKKLMIGDISIIGHQHINYFTKNSLEKLLKRAGFSGVKVISSARRSMLYGWGVKSVQREDQKNESILEDTSFDKKVFKMFVDNFSKNIVAIQDLIDKAERENKTIGLYAHCVNLKGLLKFQKEPRIFEGDKVKHGKLMTGSTNVFESPEKLLKDPVDVLFITAIDYDKEIHKALRQMGLNEQKTELVSLKNIYEENSGFKYNVGSLNYE